MKGLSHKEQEIYFKSLNKEKYVVKVKELSKDFKISENYARKLLFSLSKKKAIYRIAKGTYVLVSPDMIAKKFVRDVFQMVDQLLKKYYVAYLSAAYLHGAAEQIPFTVQIITTKQKKRMKIRNTKITFHQTRYFFGFERIKYGNYYINVSDKEKTIIDCLMRQELCGSLDEVKNIISSLIKDINQDKLLVYVKKIKESSFKQRLGYLLERYFQKNINKKFLRELEKQTGEKTYLLNTKAGKKGRLNKKWKLIIND